MTRRHPLSFLFAALLFALGSLPVAAQSSTATLSGTVEDEQGAVIPGAAITILNPSTALQRQATTNDEGSFTVTLLQPGTYTVTVRREGFAPIEVKNVVLNVGDQKALKIELKAGDVTAEVQVTTDAPLIDTSTAVATVVDRQFVGNLPLNGRSFQSLILLTPGVVQTASDSNHPGEFSVNGQRQNANYFTVDGVSANTGISTGNNVFGAFSMQAGGSVPGTTALGTTASLVSVDALEEFKIQTSTYSAEFGRQPGGQVQLVTRSGNNEFHGTGFEYLRNEAFDANNWFNNARRQKKPALRQNQFGGSFSGPVMLPRFGEGGKPFWSGRNKTFFFFSYEGQRLRLPVGATADRVPSLRLRQIAAPAVQPFLNAFPLPTGPEILTASGAPTGAAPFLVAYSNPSSVDAYSMRVDHTVSSKLSVFGRYSETPSNSLNRNLNQLVGTVNKARTLTLGSMFIINPRMNNEFRFNYSSNKAQGRFSLDDFGGAVPLTLSQLTSGYSGPGVKVGGVGINVSNLFLGGPSLGDAVANQSRQFNLVDNFSWVKGSHQIKFGIDWRRLTPIYGPSAFEQILNFDSEASLVNSTPDFVAILTNGGARPIYDNYSAYTQDTWKMSPRLTLELGLRWELNPAPRDANGLRPVVLTGINGTNVSNVSIAPPNAPFYKTFKTAFAPRVGIAYALNQSSGRETVLRGGFGVYYDLGSGLGSSLFGGFPFRQVAVLPNVFPISAALVRPPEFLPVPTQISELARQNYFAVDPSLRLPYTLAWNVGVEQSLGNQQTVSITYVASAGRRLLVTEGLNNQPRNLVTGVLLPRPNPNIGDIRYVTNGPTSDYHSLQLQYQRRLSRGLQALVNYTWSHAIDVVSTEGVTNSLDRGNADFDVRHNLSAAFTYDLPKLKGSGPLARFVKAVANGWSVDSVFYARTGLPLDLSAGGIRFPDGTFRSARPDLVLGVPIWINDPTVAGGQRLNAAAFQSPPLIGGNPFRFSRQGTLGRNIVRVPGIYQWNMAVRRQFNLGERMNLQLKAEAFNLLNHPLFGGYDRSTTSSNFGKAQNTLSNTLGGLNSLYQLGGPRSMQFSARLSF